MRLLPLALALPLAACSVSPPTPVEADGELARLVLPADARPQLKLAIAPIAATGLGMSAPVFDEGVAPLDTSDALAVRQPLQDQRLPEREYGWDDGLKQVDLARLQARSAELIGWSLLAETPLTIAGGQTSLGADALLEAAEASGADLLLSLDVRQVRSAWVERDGFMWWFDLFMFYGPGIYPIVFVPDEVYEVAALVRAQVVHVRSGRVLLERDLLGSHVDSLNDPQRGWSLGGLLFLHPYTLDEDDYQTVFEALWPHAEKQLETALLGWLSAELPARLAAAEVQDLIKLGDARRTRTLALAIGAPGPRVIDAKLDRPPPLAGATTDAEAFAALLRESGEVARADQLVLLTGEQASGERALAAVAGLGKKMLGRDRLVIYCAGYGGFDASGRAVLHLEGGEVTLEALAGAVAKAVPAESQVVWVLDTSFGGEGGRTWPSAPVADPTVAVKPLRRPHWQALLASHPKHPAVEGERPGGAFTAALLAGAKGAADADGNGSVTLVELEKYLVTWVTPEVKERLGATQRPQRIGDDGEARLVRVAPAAANELPPPEDEGQ